MPLKPAEQVGVPLPGEKHSFPDAHADRSQLIGTPVHVGCASWGSSGWWSVKPDTSTLFSQATCRNWPTNHHRSVKYHKPQAIFEKRPINAKQQEDHKKPLRAEPTEGFNPGLLVCLQVQHFLLPSDAGRVRVADRNERKSGTAPENTHERLMTYYEPDVNERLGLRASQQDLTVSLPK
jgi:hypothetical protein